MKSKVGAVGNTGPAQLCSRVLRIWAIMGASLKLFQIWYHFEFESKPVAADGFYVLIDPLREDVTWPQSFKLLLNLWWVPLVVVIVIKFYAGCARSRKF